MIVPHVLAKVEAAGARLVAVTKYLDAPSTHAVLEALQDAPCFWALGENRVQMLQAKNLPREKVHFVGNIQSRDIGAIAQGTCGLHSVGSAKHLRMILAERTDPLHIFVQINISREPQKGGILPEDMEGFLSGLNELEREAITGFSALGAGCFSIAEKEAEFVQLRQLRDRYLPKGLLCAGTSRDYEIALEQGMDIVRIGKALFGESFSG